MLTSLFSEDMGRLSKAAETPQRKPMGHTFTPDSLPVVPEEIATSHIEVLLRQRYTSYGLIDDVIIRTDRTHSTALGLWILAATLQRRHKEYRLRLANEAASSEGSPQIKTIALEQLYQKEIGLLVQPSRFVWNPSNLEDFCRRASTSPYLGQKPSVKVSNAAREWYSQTEYAARDVLVGFGPMGGACIAAEFFLNFGSPLCAMNYEYLKYERASEVADSDSCELRVEINDIESRARPLLRHLPQNES